MNDGQDPYAQDPYARDQYGRQPYDPQQPAYGYDAYGRPVYQQPEGASPEYGYPYDAQGATAYPGQPGQQGPPGHPGQPGPSGQPVPQPYDAAPGSGWGDPQAAGRHEAPAHDGRPYGEPYTGQYAGQYGERYGGQGYDPQGYPGQQAVAPQAPAGAQPQTVPEERPAGPGRGPHESGSTTATMPVPPDPAGPATPDPAGAAGSGSAAGPAGDTGGPRRPGRRQVPGQRGRRAQRGAERQQEPAAPPSRPADGPGEEPDGPYRTEQFSFLEEPDEETEDVIDWLKFAETRSERRDERRRRTRNRLIALAVVLALVVAGGVGYLWVAGKLPGQSGGSGDEAASGTGQKRDVIVLHLHETGGTGDTSTVLLVDNETTKKGTAVLLPNALAVATEEGGSTTLGKSVEESSDATREALGTLLGADISGTWRLDTPYLENLVELVDGITVDTDVTVPAAKEGAEPLVTQGKGRTLSGQAAVAYATYRAPAEPQTKQLSRFGQVMHAVLKKLSGDPDEATSTVESLAQIPDPSLSERELGASLARLAELARNGAYGTTVLPVEQDGTLSEEATDHVVEDILGGTVKNTEPGGAARVSVRNASGEPTAGSAAQIALINGGFTVVAATEAGDQARPESRVTYAEQAQEAQAKEVAKTLGLPESAVAKDKGAANADVTVVLGQDYEGTAGPGGGSASGGATGPGGATSGDSAAAGATSGGTGAGDVQGVATGGGTAGTTG